MSMSSPRYLSIHKRKKKWLLKIQTKGGKQVGDQAVEWEPGQQRNK